MKKQKAVRKVRVPKNPALSTASVGDDAPAKKPRGRVGNVRGLILSLLESGPMSSSALVTQGKFSPASVFNNMKSLKQEGLVTSARNGREVLFSLAGSDGVVPPAIKPKSAAKKGARKGLPTAAADLVLAYVPSDLHTALSGLTSQLSPVVDIDNKLTVLEQLSKALPTSIGSVLEAIRQDLKRVSGI